MLYFYRYLSIRLRCIDLIKIEIPGRDCLEIKNLVLDFNGTIARDGGLIDGVKERLRILLDSGVNMHLITADTNGTVINQCKDMPVVIDVFDEVDVGKRKRDLVRGLGAKGTVSIGNGRNDLMMFEESGLSIAVIGAEGCFAQNLSASDIVVNDILDALDLLIHKNRLKATLRS
jgi:soluble P-type ATPase